jgi:hypothetical protein
MATVRSAPPVRSDETQRILLEGIRWSTYEALKTLAVVASA